MLDKIDNRLLIELQKDSSKKIYQLVKSLNLPRSTIHNRIKRLEKNGFIIGYKAIIDHRKIGKSTTVLLHIVIGAKYNVNEVLEKLKRIEEVEEIFLVAGQFDIIAKMRVRNTGDLSKIVFDQETGIRSWTGIDRTESMIVLDEIKENGVIYPHQSKIKDKNDK